MKFRWRGGTAGFLSRSVGRAVSRSVPDNQLVSCLIAAFILAVIAGSPIIALVILGILISILPFILLLSLLIVIGIGAYFVIKKRYPQMLMCWFFLKEDEADGTILSLKEIQSRIRELLVL